MPAKQGYSKRVAKRPTRPIAPITQTVMRSDNLKGKDLSNYKQIVNHYDNRKYKQGLRQSEQFLKHQPRVPEVIAFKGLFMENLTGDGIPVLKEAIAMDPENYMVNYLAGLAYKDKDNFKKAVFYLEKARTLFKSKSTEENNGIDNELISLYCSMRKYKQCLTLVEGLEDSVYRSNSIIFFKLLLHTCNEKDIDQEIVKDLNSVESTANRKEQLALCMMGMIPKQDIVHKYLQFVHSSEHKLQILMALGAPVVYKLEELKNALKESLQHFPDSFSYQICLLARMIYKAQAKKEYTDELKSFDFQKFIRFFCRSKFSFSAFETAQLGANHSYQYPTLFDHTEIRTSDISILVEFTKCIPTLLEKWHNKVISLGAKQLTSALVYGVSTNNSDVIVQRMREMGTAFNPKTFKFLLRMGKVDMYNQISAAFESTRPLFAIGMLRQLGRHEEAYERLLKIEEQDEGVLMEKLRFTVLLLNAKCTKYEFKPVELAKELIDKYGKGNRFITTFCVRQLLKCRNHSIDLFQTCIDIFSGFVNGDWLCNLGDMQSYDLLFRFATYLHARNEAGVETQLPYDLNKLVDYPIKELFAFTLFMKCYISIEQFVTHQTDYFRYMLRRNYIAGALAFITTVRNTFREKKIIIALTTIMSMLTEPMMEKHRVKEERRAELNGQVEAIFKKYWEETKQTKQDIEYERVRSTKDVLFLNVVPEKLIERCELLLATGEPIRPSHIAAQFLINAQPMTYTGEDSEVEQKRRRIGLMLVQQSMLGKVSIIRKHSDMDKQNNIVNAVAMRIAAFLEACSPDSVLIKQRLSDYGLLEKRDVDLAKVLETQTLCETERSALIKLIEAIEVK